MTAAFTLLFGQGWCFFYSFLWNMAIDLYLLNIAIELFILSKAIELFMLNIVIELFMLNIVQTMDAVQQ